MRKQRAYVRIVERVLGRGLKGSEEIYHANGNKLDNQNENLVVCPSRAYHMLLHKREEALLACGNANYKKCMCCLKWDSPTNMHFTPVARRYWHKACKAKTVTRQTTAQNNFRKTWGLG